VAFAAPVLISRAAPAADPQRQSFTVVVQDSEAAVSPADFLDHLTQGAQEAEDAPLYRDGKKIGLAETIVIVTRVAGDDVAGLIACSVELPEGNLLFHGSAHLAGLATGAALPVVGGTGTYRGARGTVTLIAAEDGTHTTLNFDISME